MYASVHHRRRFDGYLVFDGFNHASDLQPTAVGEHCLMSASKSQAQTLRDKTGQAYFDRAAATLLALECT